MISPREAIKEAARRVTAAGQFKPAEPDFADEERRSRLSPKGRAQRRIRNRMARESGKANRK